MSFVLEKVQETGKKVLLSVRSYWCPDLWKAVVMLRERAGERERCLTLGYQLKFEVESLTMPSQRKTALEKTSWME